MSSGDLSARFLAFSSRVTAFTVFDLRGTGQAECYRSTVTRVVGERTLLELLDAYDAAANAASVTGEPVTGEHVPDEALRAGIFSSEKLGPIARNVIKLWYVGVWYALPREWTERFGALEHDGTFTASPAAYPEGLLWRAIGANPPGARAPGYGSWAHAPVIPPIPGEDPVPAPVTVPATPVAAPLADVPQPRRAQPQTGKQPQPTKETAQ